MQTWRAPGWRGLTRAALALLAGVLLVEPLTVMAAAGTLRSPWDATPPQQATTPASCPRAPDLSAGIAATSYYADAARSIADPRRKREYDIAVDPLREAASSVAGMADRYRDTGDRSAAQCAMAWLAKFAADGVLTGAISSNQARYVQGWIMGAFAATALKIRTGTGSSRETMRVGDWLARMADTQVAYYEARAGKIDGRNNHRYWAGFAMMAVGILSERQGLFDWGVASFRIGIDQITRDGTLPLEMQRGARALHYHLFAAAPLVAIAELAAANSMDLYSEENHALPRLVHRALGGVDDSAFFTEKTGQEQEPVGVDAAAVGWAAPYAQRFHDRQVAAFVARAQSTAFVYLGGKPPSVEP